MSKNISIVGKIHFPINLYLSLCVRVCVCIVYACTRVCVCMNNEKRGPELLVIREMQFKTIMRDNTSHSSMALENKADSENRC